MQPKWFSQILDYNGGNVHKQGFEQGLNLIVETPFIVAALIGVLLNLVLPRDWSAMDNAVRDGSGKVFLEGGGLRNERREHIYVRNAAKCLWRLVREMLDLRNYKKGLITDIPRR